MVGDEFISEFRVGNARIRRFEKLVDTFSVMEAAAYRL